MKKFAALLLSVAISHTALANTIYTIPQNSQEMVKFSIPYSLGTHKGNIKKVQGEVHATDSDEVLDARFVVSLDDMTTGNDVRDCHMREALGLDYTKSQFPREHVCDGAHLP